MHASREPVAPLGHHQVSSWHVLWRVCGRERLICTHHDSNLPEVRTQWGLAAGRAALVDNGAFFLGVRSAGALDFLSCVGIPPLLAHSVPKAQLLHTPSSTHSANAPLMHAPPHAHLLHAVARLG